MAPSYPIQAPPSDSTTANPLQSQPTSHSTNAKPSQSQPASPSTSSPSYRTLYLILYNFLSAVLWSAILGRVLVIASLHGWQNVFIGVDGLARAVQTLAVAEVVHSLTGLVRAPLLTTAMQVASRLLLIWGIAFLFPGTCARSPAYTTMLLAWASTEVVRYGYFAVSLAYGRVPAALTWLRYNAFFVLYPLGIGSECWLVWRAVEPAGRLWGWAAAAALRVVLGVYVPGSYILFTHMMAQRRKIMSGSDDKKKA